ncbi:MAG: TetR/AcrR family transcriptional regulator [Mycobacterium sp.]|nr:TetR/AcrR family transcriptional regulator [Mycobacterium sp.]
MTTVGQPRAARGRRSARPTGEDREQAILATARQLLEHRPFAEVSVDDLARGAGLSRPTFYFYFQSKEAVLLSLVEPLIAAVDANLEGAAARVPQDPRKMFHSGINAFFSTFRADPAVARAGMALLNHNAEFRRQWSTAMTKWIRQTAALIEAERARGAAPDTIPALDLATSLNQMNERAMIASLSAEQPAIPEAHIVDTLTHIWMASIYAGSA